MRTILDRGQNFASGGQNFASVGQIFASLGPNSKFKKNKIFSKKLFFKFNYFSPFFFKFLCSLVSEFDLNFIHELLSIKGSSYDSFDFSKQQKTTSTVCQY
jgi:hypothetical protein